MNSLHSIIQLLSELMRLLQSTMIKQYQLGGNILDIHSYPIIADRDFKFVADAVPDNTGFLTVKNTTLDTNTFGLFAMSLIPNYVKNEILVQGHIIQLSQPIESYPDVYAISTVDGWNDKLSSKFTILESKDYGTIKNNDKSYYFFKYGLAFPKNLQVDDENNIILDLENVNQYLEYIVDLSGYVYGSKGTQFLGIKSLSK